MSAMSIKIRNGRCGFETCVPTLLVGFVWEMNLCGPQGSHVPSHTCFEIKQWNEKRFDDVFKDDASSELYVHFSCTSLPSKCALFLSSSGSSLGLFFSCNDLYFPCDHLSPASACFLSFTMTSSYGSLIALESCNTIISTTSFLILLYSALHCWALKLLVTVPLEEKAFFFFLFVPKLGSCRVSFCILFSLYCIAEHRVGVSYTPQALLLLCRDLFT